MEKLDETAIPESVIAAFRDTCDEFVKLCQPNREDFPPIWIGTMDYLMDSLKFSFRHPIQGFLRNIKYLKALKLESQSSVGTLAPFFPIDTMVEFLKRFSEPQLKSLKALSEIHLRRKKSLFTESPVFKLSLPVGSAYALLEVSNKIIKVRGSSLDLLMDILNSSGMQMLMGSLLTGFIIGVVILIAQYIFVIAPALSRDQLLDDLIQITLEEKRFASGRIPNA